MARRINVPGINLELMTEIIKDPSKLEAMHKFIAELRVYPTWEYVKYHTPSEWRAEELWQAFLFLRSNNPIKGIRNHNGKAYTLSQPEVLKRKLHQAYSYMNFSHVTDTPFSGLNEKQQRIYLQRSLQDEAISSSQMEGAVTTRRVAKEMLRTGRAARDDSERMILNNYRTMEKLHQWKDRPLSVELLLEIQSTLTRGVIAEDECGRLRLAKDNIVVEREGTGEVVHVPPPADGLKERLQAIVDFANESSEEGAFYYPIEKAAILHFLIGYEHPFCDGNGRTARACFYWYLMRQGCWIVEFFSISRLLHRQDWRKIYEEAYINTEDTGLDLTYFVLMQVACFIEAAKNFYEFLKRVEQEQKAFRELLSGDLNDRQIRLVGHTHRHPGYIYTAAEHAKWNDISLNTARADLEDLRKKKYFVQKMRGKTKIWISG